MRYARVFTKIWNDEKFRDLTKEAQLVFLYLMSSPHSNAIGLYVLRYGYACDDLGMKQEELQSTLSELFEREMIDFDPNSSVLLIKNHMRYNLLENHNQVKAAVKAFDSLPRTRLKEEFVEALLADGGDWEERLATALSEGPGGMPRDHRDESDARKQHKESAVRIIEFLNEKAGRHYRASGANVDMVCARLRTGATEDQCRQIIAKKTREWKGNEKMDQFLRPATLFGKIKFEQYIGELGAQSHERVESSQR